MKTSLVQKRQGAETRQALAYVIMGTGLRLVVNKYLIVNRVFAN